jgi:hypothetical protein
LVALLTHTHPVLQAHAALKTLVKQLCYKNSVMLMSEEGVNAFITEGMQEPERTEDTKAYTMVALATDEESSAFQ